MPALKKSREFKELKKQQGDMRAGAKFKQMIKQQEKNPPKKTKFTALMEYST